MRKLLGRLALVLFGVLVGLLVTEAAVRVVAPQPLVTGYLRWENHPVVGFRLQPDTEIPGELGGRINHLGLRGGPIGDKAADEWRVLVIGDSFVYGAGVPEANAFPVALEQRLAGKPAAMFNGKRVRCINAGTVGYGTAREATWLREFGDDVAPDEVLLAFFVGNDFSNNYSDYVPTIVDGRMVANYAGETRWRQKLRIGLYESHIYRWWRRVSYNTPGLDRPDGQTDNNAVERGLGARIGIYAAEGHTPDAVAEMIEGGFTKTDEALDVVRALCLERGLPLKVVVIPDILQVDGDVSAAVVKRFPGLRNHVDEARPQRAIERWCKERDVPCLDLLELMRRETKRTGESLYLGYDPHWNEKGHAFAAEVMARRLWPNRESAASK